MAELTAEQLIDLRSDLGDNKTPPAFTDEELQRLYVRMSQSYNATVVLGFDQILADAVKLADYTQNDTEEKKSQVPGNLLKLRAIWQKKWDDEVAAAIVPPRKTSAMVNLRPVWRSKSSPNA